MGLTSFFFFYFLQYLIDGKHSVSLTGKNYQLLLLHTTGLEILEKRKVFLIKKSHIITEINYKKYIRLT